MKKLLIVIIAVASAAALSGAPSYYGLDGLYFVPAARSDGAAHFAYSSVPSTASDLSLFPYSVRGNFKVGFVEIGFTNTYAYYAEDDIVYLDTAGLTLEGGGFELDRTTYAPIVPSVKIAFPDEAVPNGSLAVGFEFPYGAFLSFDYLIPLTDPFSLQIVVGMGTTFSTLSSFGGVLVDLPLGLALAVEAGYSGKSVYLTRAQEMFLSAGFSYDLTGSVAADFVFRLELDGSRRLLCGVSIAM